MDSRLRMEDRPIDAKAAAGPLLPPSSHPRPLQCRRKEAVGSTSGAGEQGLPASVLMWPLSCDGW